MVPLLQGCLESQSRAKVSEVTRDGSFEFRFGTLSGILRGGARTRAVTARIILS
jgi:hypothetical protein